LIGDVASKIATQLPDIGHFIKTVSNALYKLAEHDTILKGAGLLEGPRICAMSSDLARHIQEFNITLEMFCDQNPQECHPMISIPLTEVMIFALNELKILFHTTVAMIKNAM
jgi:hypothetical protein